MDETRSNEMNEQKFKEKLKEQLQKQLSDEFNIGIDKNLIYKVIVNEEFKYEPDEPKTPKRGTYAFQTDLLITNKNNFPLVVIETKYGGFSTHDVLIYSTKAQKHKEIYPHLRYGLVVGGEDKIKDKIYNRFFTHNIGFDFAYALNDENDTNSIGELVRIIKQQIKNSTLLLEILTNKKQAKSFNTIYEFHTL